jgi:hypothetical protein
MLKLLNTIRNFLRLLPPSPRLVLGIGAICWGAIAAPVQAEELFGNQGIQFSEDTVVEFEFVESHGAYQSTFGVINLETGEKTPLIQEVKPADDPQSIVAPSSFQDDAGRGVDFLGTPGDAVPQPLAEFEFKANERYAFYLESFFNGRSEQIFYSIDSQNPAGTRRVEFDQAIEALGNGGVLLSWDDTGSLLLRPSDSQDRDFDDFLVRAGGHLACP